MKLFALFFIILVIKADLIAFENDVAIIQPQAKIQLGEIQISFENVNQIINLAQKMMKVCGADLSVCLKTDENAILLRDLDNLKAFEPIVPQEIKQLRQQQMQFRQSPVVEYKSQQQIQEEDLDNKVNSLLYG